jgi:hypothetical protein
VHFSFRLLLFDAADFAKKLKTSSGLLDDRYSIPIQKVKLKL